MTQGELLFQAILQDPGDDVLRLAYSDWLEEQGNVDHATFIRLQIEKASLPLNSATRVALQQQERELVRQHQQGWPQCLPRFKGIGWQRYWRGFVAGITVETWKHYRRHADQAFRLTPIQFLRMQFPSEVTCQRLADSPFLGRLRGLHLEGAQVRDDGIIALSRSPHLKELRVLDLHLTPGSGQHISGHLSDRGAAALCESSSFSQLRTIDLRGQHGVRQSGIRRLRERFGEGDILCG